MRVRGPPTRRDAVFGIAGAAVAAAWPCPSLAQAAPHVAVIGGGFGGAACARALKRLDSRIEVTLIEANKTFVSCPFSNEVIAGLREFEVQQFGYDRIAADGIAVAAIAATKVDPQTRTVGLVTLPGAFVGVLIGSGDPVQAGAAQLLVLIGLLAAEALAVVVTGELVARGRIRR